MRASAVLFVLALLAPAAAQEAEVPADAWEGVEKRAVTVGERFAAGSTLSYWFHRRVVIEGGPVSPAGVEQGLLVERRLVAVEPDGAVKATETVRQVLFSQTSAAGTQTVDTRDGRRSENPLVDCMAELVGAAFELRLGKDGAVDACAGGTAALDRVQEVVPEGARPRSRAPLAALLGDEAHRRRAQSCLGVLPPGELRPGRSWSVQTKQSIPAEPELELPLELEHIYLGTVIRDGVRCAKVLVRARSVGLERATTLRSPRAQFSVKAFTTTSAIYLRTDDWALVGGQPIALDYRLCVESPGLPAPLEVRIQSIDEVRLEAAAPR